MFLVTVELNGPNGSMCLLRVWGVGGGHLFTLKTILVINIDSWCGRNSEVIDKLASDMELHCFQMWV